jgi:hypothetical protein
MPLDVRERSKDFTDPEPSALIDSPTQLRPRRKPVRDLETRHADETFRSCRRDPAPRRARREAVPTSARPARSRRAPANRSRWIALSTPNRVRRPDTERPNHSDEGEQEQAATGITER